ncbi:hypothetical protein MJO28_003255 [Puccinia striiformis f. sp. tritici]|uniref:Uncharacterized protein n=2 Tax=Puccinia striiformis TaxID=27350 RepID=A0A2S4UUZ3_9BASI|nr:hypothetical protein MJO28_003255 [Puccinia striiformis f. sp. tritici]POW00955.1 hypothetical protein PSTT_12796 [Puccinia striiformis]
MSLPRQTVYHTTHQRNGHSHRIPGQNHDDRQRYMLRDRSQEHDFNGKYKGSSSRVPARGRDYARDDDFDDRPPYKRAERSIGVERMRPSGVDTDQQQVDRNPTAHHQTYRPRPNQNGAEPRFPRDGHERHDYRQIDQAGPQYSTQQHFSYVRWANNRQSDYTTCTQHQGQYFQSSSHHRQPYSPHAAPSPGKSPMRRPLYPHQFLHLNRNHDRLPKGGKLDYGSHRLVGRSFHT